MVSSHDLQWIKKRKTPVEAGRSTGFVRPSSSPANSRVCLALGTSAVPNTSNMLVFEALLHDGTSLQALVDTGASENFISKSCIERLGLSQRVVISAKDIVIRLATGITKVEPQRIIRLKISLQGFNGIEEFFVLDMDDKYDIIVGMPWLRRHAPQIDWANCLLRSRDERFPGAKASSSLCAIKCDTPDCDGVNSIAGEQCRGVSRQIQDDIQPTDRIDHGMNQFQLEAQQVSRVKKKLQRKKRVRFAKEVTVYHISGNDKSGDDFPGMESHVGVLRPIVNMESKEIRVTKVTELGLINQEYVLESPPMRTSVICDLDTMTHDEFLNSLKCGEIEQICFNRPELEDVPISVKAINCQSSSVEDEAVLNEKTKIERFESQGWDSLKGSPFYEVLKEYEDVFPEEVPAELPKDKGIRHEIDLIPGTKYCVTRQWPLPKEQVDVIDEFFAKRLASGQVRESKSPHCSPTFCVKKATGGWRIVHAYNKLNSATVPAQTPIPRKDMIIDRMQGSTIFSTIDLRDGYYQILMRESDIPLTAVSTPSGMLWEWLVMPQGLSNAPATFN
jgi:hypothetical protein